MTTDFSLPIFLEKVRGGQALGSEELKYFIANLTSWPEAQVGAFLAHAFHKPLSKQNTVDLTLAMRDSGTVMRWDDLGKTVVDKHSTGGVGDKITLPLAPLFASLGLAIPSIAGRGLGFTGGTVDKLESIPGFTTGLSPEKTKVALQETGMAFLRQTADIAPADAKLYALRDVTATVESLPLITASILSKKLAEGLGALVLDVKWGTGAFMSTLESARALAKSLVDVANGAGTKTTALITSMNQPLGTMSGNWSEVVESVHILRNEKDPDLAPHDVRDLTIALAAQMLLQIGWEKDAASARKRCEAELASGRPYEIFCRAVDFQGGNAKIFDGPLNRQPQTKEILEIRADRAGIVQSIDTKSLGRSLVLAGAGRETAADEIDAQAWLEHPVKIGQNVAAGTVLCRLATNRSDRVNAVRQLLSNSFTIGDNAVTAPPLIQEVIA